MTRSRRAKSLVEEFVEQAIRHATATNNDVANRAADRLADIYRALRKLDAADLSDFLNLTTHEHDAVRLWAASYGLEVDATFCEPVLEALAAGPRGEVRASASFTLREWRSGRLKFP